MGFTDAIQLIGMEGLAWVFLRPPPAPRAPSHHHKVFNMGHRRARISPEDVTVGAEMERCDVMCRQKRHEVAGETAKGKKCLPPC